MNPALSALLRLMSIAPRHQTAVVLALMVVVALTEGIGIMLLVPLIQLAAPDGATAGGPVLALLPIAPGASIHLILAVFVALVLLRAVLVHVQQIRTARLVHHVVDTLRGQCHDAVIHAEWRWLSQQQAAMIGNLIITNVSRIGAGLHQATGLIAGTVSALAFLAAALALDWTLAIAAMTGGGALMILASGQRKQVARLGQALGRANHALHAQTQEGVASIRLMRLWQGEARAAQDFAQTMADLRGVQIDHQISAGRGRIALQTGGAVLLALVVYGGLVVLSVPQAVLLPILLVFVRLVPALGALQVSWHHWLHTVPALTEAETFLADARAVAEAQPPQTLPPLTLRQEMRLDGVTVRHAGRDGASLNAVRLVIPAGSTTAITGPSGAGKSTLADVLTGLITPDEGQMLIDGQPVTAALRGLWRQSVGYVQQDGFLFNASLRDNLRRACPDADDAAMARALRLAAAEFAFALPQGLDTQVGDNGLRLSGGERQRIALARALLRQPAVLILDEATSAVDPGHEHAILRAIAGLKGQMTIIVITHRAFATLAPDQVFTLSPPDNPP